MKNIEVTLIQMSNLIKKHQGQTYWSDRLEMLATKTSLHEDDFKLAIKQLFGGMGTLNDLAIMDQKGKYPLDANSEFDELRQHLREMLRAWN